MAGDSWCWCLLFLLVVCKPQACPKSIGFQNLMQLPFLVLGWTVVTKLDTVGGFVGSGEFWSLGFVGLHLLFLACRLARKRIYEAWRRRVGWTVLEQFHPMSPNVIHSYPILTLFGDSWWFLMLMPSFFVLVVCKPQAYPESRGFQNLMQLPFLVVCRFSGVLILRFCRSALVVLACRLARKRIYRAWRRRVGWTVLGQCSCVFLNRMLVGRTLPWVSEPVHSSASGLWMMGFQIIGFKTVYLWLWLVVIDYHDVSLHVSVNVWFYESLILGFLGLKWLWLDIFNDYWLLSPRVTIIDPQWWVPGGTDCIWQPK